MEKNQNKTFLILAFIIAAGMLRLLLTIKLPNFSPVWAMMLFGGVYLKDRRLAIIAPLGTMFFTDLTLEILHHAGWREYPGFYNHMSFVYFGFLLNVLIGMLLKGNIKPGPLAGGGLLATTIFFIVSNFGVWAMGGYAPTQNGLIECYYQGLPFYGYSIISTLIFIPVMFGGYEYIKNRYPASASAGNPLKGQDVPDALHRRKVHL